VRGKRLRSFILSTLVILGLIFINFIIQIGVKPSYKSMSTDSGTFAYCGQIIRTGGLMYRDCWDNKPPAVYYLNAFAIWLGGSNPFAIWLFQAIWLTIAIIVFYLIMTLVWQHQVLAALSSFGLLLMLLYPDIFQGGNFTETYAILPVVLSMGVFWAYIRSAKRLWLVILGLIIAAGFLLKPTYISFGLASTIVLIILRLRGRAFRAFLQDIAIIGLSTAFPLVIVGAYWVWRQDFSDLWFAVFAHNVTYVTQGFSLVSLYGTARLFLVQQPMAMLSILVGLALVLFLLQHHRTIFPAGATPTIESDTFSLPISDVGQARVWFMIAIFLAFILDVIFLASSGKNFGHYLQIVLPGMVVALLYLLDYLHHSFFEQQTRQDVRIAVLGALIIVFLGGGLEIVAKELPSLTEIKAFINTPNLTIYQPTELEQYILNQSLPSDTVLIWAGHPDMNFVTHRQSPTKFIFLQHLFSPIPNHPNGFSVFLQEMQSNPPSLIVVQPVSSAGLPYFENQSDPACANCDPSILAALAELRQYVNLNYTQSFAIWDWVVFSRNP
jgi:hypothetical protein